GSDPANPAETKIRRGRPAANGTDKTSDLSAAQLRPDVVRRSPACRPDHRRRIDRRRRQEHDCRSVENQQRAMENKPSRENRHAQMRRSKQPMAQLLENRRLNTRQRNYTQMTNDV